MNRREFVQPRQDQIRATTWYHWPRMGSYRPHLVLAALLLVGAAVFIRGSSWGLPSRERTDPFLFGSRARWSGEQIKALAPPRPISAGADVDVNPNLDRSRPIRLNQTDAQRAEIVRRYRLYTCQPDEMITMMALARAGQTRGDPQLYQYGGLWIYPVGVLIKLAAWTGMAEVRADESYYLEHPEQFGRFYVIARLYSAAWGLAGVVAVFLLARRLMGGANEAAAPVWMPAAAALCYIFLPVVVTMAHEAKPHLPGAVLMLLTVLAAGRYVCRGKTLDAILTGTLCGAATGMVISAAPIFLVLPVMLWRRKVSAVWLRHGLRALAAGLLIYLATNPFVAINAIWHPSILKSNLANSTAMYAISLDGIANAFALVRDGTGIAIFAVAIVVLTAAGAAAILIRGWITRHTADLWWLLCIPAGVVFGQFALLAAGKPPEHARFAILPDIVLILIALAPLSALLRRGQAGRYQRGLAAIISVLIAGSTALAGSRYCRAFLRDPTPASWRHRVAEALSQRPGVFYLSKDPAPYNCPPVDLWANEIYLLPDAPAQIKTGLVIEPADAGDMWSWTRIAWADKKSVLKRTTSTPPAARAE